ncbi:MAG: NADPH-dependent glutamate synthase [Desulfonauticus sp.]|nr:NADPH-dependent glutamate synthase [Desulfonauticus sp.]
MEKKKRTKKIQPRTPMPEQDPKTRIHNFSEVALGYNLELAITEAKRCLQCKNPTCQQGCPVDVDCKTFIRFVAEGKLEEAYLTIQKTNSLPAVCGRVCPQENQCEGSCKLAPTGQPIAIGRLERFVADSYYAKHPCDDDKKQKECIGPKSRHKVAAIGSGPSSLTFAGYLALRGIKVTIFEALHEAGGVLVYGIPEFRLPKKIVHTELEALKAMGVEIKTNYVVGSTLNLQDIFDQGYEAIFIGVGAGLPRFLGLEGENLIGVYSANEYLTRVNLMRAYKFPDYDTPLPRGQNVVVIGGGNVAMDAARTALRLGAKKVYVVYRRTQQEMPARREELHHALDEGVRLKVLSSPVKFLGDEQGKLQKLVLQKMELGEPDASGRRSPIPIPGQFEEIVTDLAIIAVGTRSNPLLLQATPQLKLNQRGYIEINPDTGETSIPNVFAGGDIVTGAATVVLAMGAGRKAAQEVAKRLKLTA